MLAAFGQDGGYHPQRRSHHVHWRHSHQSGLRVVLASSVNSNYDSIKKLATGDSVDLGLEVPVTESIARDLWDLKLR
ncbi:hypothetical protein Cob_v010494 [Colletotrichum orbiculare MAFF 240422]|uniref:Uncharacterized protein n=1 Tax=Colletotrichum orbiculare (strain 104-T / ATCC 96160 / CBS 514.97 / LARS 414 / MAFF 240422) TaxID=1213857 RepID=A0A484FDX6_COLOR|nr:hypothetical protein Cob_v010494 [Colletotrichum orbiculare MAFF 240422]